MEDYNITYITQYRRDYILWKIITDNLDDSLLNLEKSIYCRRL